MSLFSAMSMEARERLKVRLGLTPTPAKSGVQLTPAQEARLAEMIAEAPDASHGEIARRFASETGRKVAESTVTSRRGRRWDAGQLRPLTPEQAATLSELVRAAGPDLIRGDVAVQFEARTGRPVSPQTVTAYSTRIHGPRQFRAAGKPSPARYSSPAAWPEWTDQVRFTIAGPKSGGGAR